MDNLSTRALTESRLRRLARMSLAELRCRGRQQSAKLIDRVRPDGRTREPRKVLARHAPLFTDVRASVDSLRRTFDERFFTGACIAALSQHDNADIERITAEADRILTGRFDLLGYEGLSFGDPIDWHADPVWSRRAPSRHWSKINALDPATVGDSKVIWELNRHQWMVRLAQATAFTGETRYGKYAVDQMLNWIDANPIGRGINWASSLEVALRVISWSWVMALLRHSDVLAGTALTTILASVHAHANHVQRYLSHYYSPNTHLTGEALGLFYAGCLFPQFADARRWRDTGADTLVTQATRQITADGVYFEQSTCYQRYTCDIYLHFLLLAGRSGVAVPAHVRQRVARLVDFVAELGARDGTLPNIGDADGGWLLPLARREADDCRGTLSVAAAVLDRPDWSDTVTPERLWLTNSAPVAGSAAIRRESKLYTEGGYAILRSGAHEVLVDVGPLGAFGHGHADLLSVQCSIHGERCLVDAGTYGYTVEPAWRDYFRGTTAHNTVAVDGRSQAAPNGPFGWQSRPAVRIREWQSNTTTSVIDAEHDAYAGITHRRRVVAVADGPFVIVDDLLGDGMHAFELTFQFAPITVTWTSRLSACATTLGGHQLLVTAFSSAPLTARIISGETDPIRGWVSPVYGQKTPAPALVYAAEAALPVRVVTLLYPQ